MTIKLSESLVGVVRSRCTSKLISSIDFKLFARSYPSDGNRSDVTFHNQSREKILVERWKRMNERVELQLKFQSWTNFSETRFEAFSR